MPPPICELGRSGCSDHARRSGAPGQFRAKPSGTRRNDEWKALRARHGPFTVAHQFGGAKNRRDKSREIEAFFARMDQERWEVTCQRNPTIKVRAGYAFAEEANLADYSDQLRELWRLWSAIVARLAH